MKIEIAHIDPGTMLDLIGTHIVRLMQEEDAKADELSTLIRFYYNLHGVDALEPIPLAEQLAKFQKGASAATDTPSRN